MEWMWNIATGVAVAAIVGPATWAISQLRARRAAAQWTLEQITGDEWTIRRDSPRAAFSLHVWEEGDGHRHPEVAISEYIRRGDVAAGQSVRVKGIRPNTEVRLDWVERDKRLAARVLVRDGMSKIVLTRADAHRFDW